MWESAFVGNRLYIGGDESKTVTTDTVNHALHALPLIYNGYPLSPNHDLRAGGTGALSLGLRRLEHVLTVQGGREDFHVSHHNLFRCSTGTLPHPIPVMLSLIHI